MTELRTCAHCGTAEGELTEFNGRLYGPVKIYAQNCLQAPAE